MAALCAKLLDRWLIRCRAARGRAGSGLPPSVIQLQIAILRLVAAEDMRQGVGIDMAGEGLCAGLFRPARLARPARSVEPADEHSGHGAAQGSGVRAKSLGAKIFRQKYLVAPRLRPLPAARGRHNSFCRAVWAGARQEFYFAGPAGWETRHDFLFAAGLEIRHDLSQTKIMSCLQAGQGLAQIHHFPMVSYSFCAWEHLDST